MAEGDKALAEAKSTFDNALAEPESAPQVGVPEQIAAEPAPEPAADAVPAVTAEATPAAIEAAIAAPVEVPVENKPAKAAAE